MNKEDRKIDEPLRYLLLTIASSYSIDLLQRDIFPRGVKINDREEIKYITQG